MFLCGVVSTAAACGNSDGALPDARLAAIDAPGGVHVDAPIEVADAHRSADGMANQQDDARRTDAAIATVDAAVDATIATPDATIAAPDAAIAPASADLSPGPVARFNAVSAFDPDLGETILFGGLMSNFADWINLNDTWSWDGTTWTQLSSNPAQSLLTAGIAFDSHRGVTVLFGMADVFDQGTQEYVQSYHTWELSGTTWTETVPTHNAPSDYGGANTQNGDMATMIFDSSLDKVVLLTSSTFRDVGAGQAWAWDGSNWSNITTEASLHDAIWQTVAYDAVRNAIVVYGSNATSDCPSSELIDNSDFDCTEVWEYDGSAWTLPVQPVAPLTTWNHGSTYDSDHDEMLVFGGDGAGNGSGGNSRTGLNASQVPNDVWSWNGTSWTRNLATGGSPSARDNLAMAYDVNNHNTVMFGGVDHSGAVLADTWTWNGSAWTHVTPVHSPPARSRHAMAFDLAHNVIVLVGGADATITLLGDTWTWDGSDWTQLSTGSSLTARSGAALAFDATNNELLLFGGEDASGLVGDTLALTEANDWLRYVTASHPSARSRAAMASDIAGQRILLFGGVDATGDLNDTWLWDGSGWSAVLVPVPTVREAATMIFDTQHDEFLMFGGGFEPADQDLQFVRNYNDIWSFN